MSFHDRVRRWHSPSIFALIALCFLLPFGTMRSCDSSDELEASFTGIQMVTRSVPLATGSMNSDPASARREEAGFTSAVEKSGALAAEVAFGAAIVGLVLGLLGVAGGGWCAAVGIGALLVFGVRFAADWDGRLHAGYGLALLLFVWAGILHLRRFVRRRRRPDKARLLSPSVRGMSKVVAGLVGAILGIVLGVMIGASFGRGGAVLGLLLGAPTGATTAVLLLRDWDDEAPSDERRNDSASPPTSTTGNSLPQEPS